MAQYELIAPCHFGLEAVLKREIIDLGYEIVKVEDGSVKLAISAPRDVTILRKEVFDRVKEENKEATSGDLDILKLLK